VVGRIGRAAWATLTSVRFAVILIIAIVVSGLIGTLVRQFPSSVLHDPVGYAKQVADMHQRWDANQVLGIQVGPTMVDLFDKLGFFRVFSAVWFVALLVVLVVAIVCCTLDRTPRLWRSVQPGIIDQPLPFFDLRLPERAALEQTGIGPDEVVGSLRRRHFKVRRAASEDGGTLWFQGDRNQYLKLTTLLTHLGLILFLVGGAVTVSFGFETVVFVGEGQTAPVQPVGTPDNLLLKVNSFAAPRLESGAFADFVTDLSVFQNGQEIARKQIRVNDPLEVRGFVFHQNTFGPSVDLTIHDASGQLVWTGPILLDDTLAGFPSGFATIPGSDVGVLAVLTKTADGTSALLLQGVGPADATGVAPGLFRTVIGVGSTADPSATAGYTISWDGISAWSGMVVKNDPGAPVIWFAFLCLISGLVMTFYLPRRRAWIRMDGDTIRVAMLGDRYVDLPREMDRLMDELRSRSAARMDAVTPQS
jgi:cytochrome c biogenesis protein